MRETKDLKYKESVTNTFLKTVSAFAELSSPTKMQRNTYRCIFDAIMISGNNGYSQEQG